MDAHLAVVTNKGTGLFHGALYRNHPTPSGCDRYLLSLTMDVGHPTYRAAAEAANAAFPGIEPLSLDGAAGDDLPAGGLGLDPRSVITRITTQRPGDPMDDAPDVEVRLCGRTLPITVSKGQFDNLLALGHIEIEGGTGSDPGLYYSYDEYVLTPIGRRAHKPPKPRKAA